MRAAVHWQRNNPASNNKPRCKMKYPYHTKSRVLRVVGTLWSGVECSHEYTLHDGQNPVDLADAKLIAGDFECLRSARIWTRELAGTETLTTKRLK